MISVAELKGLIADDMTPAAGVHNARVLAEAMADVASGERVFEAVTIPDGVFFMGEGWAIGDRRAHEAHEHFLASGRRALERLRQSRGSR